MFGGLRVLDGQGRALNLPARKAAALMAYLAMHPGRAHPRSRLAMLCWGSSGESAARASLRQALLVLRRALTLTDDELIAGSTETIMLAEQVARVDALELEAATADGNAGFDAQAMSSLLDGLDGEFLEGLDTREPGFDDWLALRREQLRARLVSAHARLVGEYRARTQPDAAIASALRLLALDPLREDVHRSLMEIYAGQRRWSAALHQFQLCRNVLARELGVRPEPATLQVRDAIERQRSHAAAEPAPPGETTPAASSALRHVALLGIEWACAAREPDPERASQLADHALRGAIELIEGFGGTFERRPGSGLLACFGAQSGHGDDDERAARCARRLVEDLPELRVGLAAGLVLLAPENGANTALQGGSEVIGVASRLVAAAAPAEVLVAEATWRMLAPLAEGERCADQALPASLRGAGVHRLLAMRRRPQRRTALVGRRAELAQFATLIDACMREGNGSVLHVRGEPGIGKTRLSEEFCSIAAARGFRAHVGTVLDFGSSAERDAIRTLVLDLLEVDPIGASPPMVNAGIEAAIVAGVVDADDAAGLHALARQNPPAGLQALVDAMDHSSRVRMLRRALTHLVTRRAIRAPRLLVLEDLQWADEDTLAHALALATVTSVAPVLLVTTARSDGDPLDEAWRQASGANTLATLDIGPLRKVDADTLAAQLADAADPFTLGCIDRAAGNPLFLELLLHADRSQPETMPATVQSVIQARLDRLATAEHEALRVASVLGQRFALAALEHLLGAQSAWDPKLAKGLLRADGADGMFAHALVRDGAYASLPRARRRALHAQAASWFASRDPVLHAEQLEGAEDPAAASAWLLAARTESAAQRHQRAVVFASRGLALASAAADQFALACCKAEALQNLGNNADAHVAWQYALQCAPDDARRCSAWIGVGSALRLCEDLDGAATALEHAAAIAATQGLTEASARVHLLRGNLLFPLGDLDGCRREHTASLELARQAGSIEIEAAALGGLGDAEYMRGHMLSAERRFSDCVALAQRDGLRRIEAAHHPMVAWTRWFAGDYIGSLQSVALGISHARAIGHLRAEAIAHHIGYLARHALLEFDAAREHAQHALHLAQRLASPRFEAEALAFLGDLEVALGQREQGVERLQRAISIARASGMAFMGPVYLSLLAQAVADDRTLREAALTECEALLTTNGLAHNHLLARRCAINACMTAGDVDAIRHHAQRLELFTRAQPLPWSNFIVRRAHALAEGIAGHRSSVLNSLTDEARRLGLAVDAIALMHD